MNFFQFKSFSFVNSAIKRIVQHIKANAKNQCFLVNLTNATFWNKTPRGQEILEFFKRMTDSQTIEFLGLFDIFVVGFQNGINAYVAMTADPSSRNFEKTLWVSISKGYNRFSENFSGRATPLGDLRSSIGSPSPASGFQDSSMGSSFQQGFSTFGAGPAQQFSPFQGFGGPATQPVSPFQGFGGPASGFSLFSAQPQSFGGYFQPIAQGDPTNPFTSQSNFIPVQPTDEPISRKGQTRLEIKKGRIVSVEIPSGCSSGPSTSSTVGISKSPKAPTPLATTIANLEKKIARLETENPAEGSSDYLTLVVSRAKLEKLRNSL